MAIKTASKTLPLTLPPEIRLIIYEFFFADVQQQHFPHPLLRVSSTIRNECIPILFTLIQLEIQDQVDVSGPWLFGFQSSRYAARSLGVTKGYTWDTICELPLVLDLLPLVRTLDVTHVTCCFAEDHEASTTIKFHGGRDAAGRPNEVDFLSWFDGSHKGTEEEVEKQLWPDGRVQVELTCRLANGEEVDLIPPAKGENVVKWLEPYPEWLQKVQNEELGQALDSNR
ncbi:hypothetical protein D6C85_06233 [Aureobasidium pullulans]|uniref:Uncharacterized protein n=1 Tax=Aureobasidium pullulans TaxID=5580 RepID=A0A4V4KXL9_AURPU|nr:hypothetical protein D6C85_06233 [Aureobasidium pullulans]